MVEEYVWRESSEQLPLYLSLAGAEKHDAQIGECFFSLVQHEVRRECLRRSEHYVGAIGDELAPGLAERIVDLGGDQAKRAAAGIRAYVEDSARATAVGAWMMVDVVFV